ncbi:MAG: extracellular solute-binding protein [Sphaerochaetaceae bacterium]|nr:extracellular solute-binding protein [Sphaerochaetaceae bacterium]
MKKKGLLVLLILVVSLPSIVFASGAEETKSMKEDKVELTFSSWRTEDVDVYEEVISMFEEKYPNISVTYRPYKTEEYQTVLAANFKGGTAADVIHLRAYGNFEQFAKPGYLLPLTEENVPGLANFDSTSLAGGTSIYDNKVYGVPYASQSLVIYYNKDIYKDLGLSEPETWNEYINNLKALKAAGITPISNGTYTGWMDEVLVGLVGSGVYKNAFFDEVTSGETDFTDPRYVAALDRVNSLTPYFPEGFESIDYVAQQMLFINGMAGHFMGGIWEASYFLSQNEDLNLGMFVCPPDEKGGDRYIAFYMDGSYGVNKTSTHQEEALEFVNFLASKDVQQFLSDKLGVKTEHKDVVPQNSYLKVVSDPSLIKVPYLMLVGFRYEQPTGSSLLQTGIQGLFSGDMSSEEVCADIQKGVATYYKPFQK